MPIPITHHDLALPTSGKPFSHPDWVFELKYDGFRVLALKDAGDVRLLSRQGSDMAAAFPELVEEIAALPGDVAIDGELTVIDENAVPHLERLRYRATLRKPHAVKLAAATEPAVIFAIDLLHAHDKDHRGLPLVVRKAALQILLHRSRRICCAAHVEEDGAGMYAQAAQLGVEGIVAKRAESTYTAGLSKDWVKITTSAGRAREASRIESDRRR
jgi:bifunctional non-homologous end joining protein LigD